MRRLFNPAVSLMNRLQFSQKFLLVGLFCLVPLAITLYLLVGEINHQIDFAQRERIGLEYNSAVKQLIDDTQQHRGMSSAFLNGDPLFKEKLLAKEDQINKDIQAIEAMDQKSNPTLKVAEPWHAATKKWLALKNDLFTLSSKNSFTRHTALIAELIDLTKQVSTESNLSLDPKPDTNFLITAIGDKLLNEIESLGQVRAKGAGIAAKKALTVDEKIELVVLSKNLSASLQDMSKKISFVYQQNNELKNILNANSQESTVLTQNVLDLLNTNIINAKEITIKPTEYFNAVTAGIEANYKFYDTGILTLDKMLEDRITKNELLRNIVSAISLLVLLFVIYLLQAFHLSIKQVISNFKDVAALVADGRLNTQVEIGTTDELKTIGLVFNNMTESLRSLVANLRETVDHMSSTSEEMNASAEHSAQSANQVADSITEVAQGAEKQLNLVESATDIIAQISKTMHQVSDNTMTATDSTKKTEAAATNGEQTVVQAMNQMVIIEQKTAAIANVIHELDEKSTQIGQIVETISAIAGQTNLLALNAAIEAARAGDFGKGFSVVADEVRKLAEQSEISAKQIAMLIDEVQKKTNTAVTFMNEGRNEVIAGTEIVNIAGQNFREILKMIREISNQIHEIATSTQDITTGSQHVVDAVQKIDKETKITAKQTQTISAATKEQTAAMQEIAVSSQALAKISEELQSAIFRFKI